MDRRTFIKSAGAATVLAPVLVQELLLQRRCHWWRWPKGLTTRP